jgi:hypothetical protein
METKKYAGIRADFVIVVCFLSIVFLAHPRSASAQTDKFNGTYAGLQTLTEKESVTNYAKCLKGPFKRRLIVKDGTAVYTFNPTYQGQVTATVSADGNVSGSTPEPSGGVALDGKIEGDDFTGEVWSLYCTYSLQLKRVP